MKLSSQYYSTTILELKDNVTLIIIT